MVSTASTLVVAQTDDPHDRISLRRLAWVAPLTLVVSLAACISLRFIVQSLNPSLARMPQLREPMFALTIEGVVAAVVVFALFATFVPRPIFWYRIVGVVALLISFLPDIALAVGGAPMMLSMTVMGPLTSLGQPGPSGPPPGGFPGGPPGGFAGGPPPGGSFTTPIEQVLVLMLLHVAVAAVCIGLLTTLTRGGPRRFRPERAPRA
jgi:hypothetical protein